MRRLPTSRGRLVISWRSSRSCECAQLELPDHGGRRAVAHEQGDRTDPIEDRRSLVLGADVSDERLHSLDASAHTADQEPTSTGNGGEIPLCTQELVDLVEVISIEQELRRIAEPRIASSPSCADASTWTKVSSRSTIHATCGISSCSPRGLTGGSWISGSTSAPRGALPGGTRRGA